MPISEDSRLRIFLVEDSKALSLHRTLCYIRGKLDIKQSMIGCPSWSSLESGVDRFSDMCVGLICRTCRREETFATYLIGAISCREQRY